MKFVRGIVIGGLVSAGVAMMYKQSGMNKRKMMRKGKQLVKKMGIV